MICTSEIAVDNFPHAEFRAAVQTAVVVHANFAGRITPHDDVSPKASQSNRVAFDVRRLANRIPHVLKTNAKLSIQLNLRAQ
jgi:hypothetical protein